MVRIRTLRYLWGAKGVLSSPRVMVYQNKGFDPGLNPSFINLWRKEYLEDEWPWEWQEYMGAVSWTRWEAWNLLCNIQREGYAERAIRIAQFEVASNFLGSLHQFRCVIIYPLGSPSLLSRSSTSWIMFVPPAQLTHVFWSKGAGHHWPATVFQRLHINTSVKSVCTAQN